LAPNRSAGRCRAAQPASDTKRSVRRTTTWSTSPTPTGQVA